MRRDRTHSRSGKLEMITRWVVRRRWWVLAAWLVIVLVAGSAASGLPDLFKSQAALPGTDSQLTEDVLQREFGQKSLGAFTLVVRDRARPADELVPAAQAAAVRAAAQLPTGKVAAVRPVSEHVVAAEIVSRLDPMEADEHTGAMRAAAGTVPGADTWLTGDPAIRSDLEPVLSDDLKIGELYIALPIAFAVLIFVFGTAAFLIPMAFAMAAIPTTLGVVWIFAHFMDMEQTVQNLVTLIGLGIAIDYSLLIVYRYREELRRTARPRDGDRQRDVHRRARGGVLGHRGRHRTRAADAHARAGAARLRRRRAADPAGVGCLRAHTPPRPAVRGRTPARPDQADPAPRARAARSGHRAQPMVAPRRSHHAAARALPRRLADRAATRGEPGPRAPARPRDAGEAPGQHVECPGSARAAGRHRRRRALADADRPRHRTAGRVRRARGPGRRRGVLQGAR